MKTPTTRLEKFVASTAKKSGYDTPESFLKEVCEHSCQSGIVGALIYYTDTVKFYRKYRKEINDLLVENMDNSGADSPSGLFGDKRDTSDPLAHDEQNQNLLAWFGFEESAMRLLGNDW